MLGHIAVIQGHFEEAEDFRQRAIALCHDIGHQYRLAVNLAELGRAQGWRGRFDQAHARLAEALAQVNEMEFIPLEAWVIALQAMTDLYAGRYEIARVQAETALAKARELEVKMIVDAPNMPGSALGVLGWLALVDGRYSEARDLCSESLAAYTVHGLAPLQEHVAWSLVGQALGLYELGNTTEARGYILEALEGALELRSFVQLLHVMPTIPVFLADTADVQLKERGVELCALAGSHPFVANSPLFEEIAGKRIAASTAGLSPKVVEAAQERGRALDWWETAEVLLEELRDLGWAARDE
jgi:tetratricopeptide (TPR) repeat protein